MADAGWPELEWEAWKDTCDTLHMWTQIVGKTRLALTPLQNHWWNVPLYVSARGLTTSAMPWRGDVLEVEFDFCEHVLELRLGQGERACEVRAGAAPAVGGGFLCGVQEGAGGAGRGGEDLADAGGGRRADAVRSGYAARVV